MTERISAARETLAGVIDPLREQLSTLDEEIARQERQLSELRTVRREIAGALRYLTPDDPKKPKKARLERASYAKLSEVEQWLKEHVLDINGNGGFSAADLRRRSDFVPIGRGTLAAVMTELHERGVLRLDHVGTGRAKYWKVVV